MKTHPKKEIRIICELPLSGRMRAHLDRAPISGYTMLPAIGGKGSEGAWSREGLVGDAGQMVVFLIILDASELEAVLDDLYAVIANQIGIITIADVEVVRPERF
ncbi:MAG TPA: transcriptional regulator [Rhizobiaceae bacterium]|nr:transcriptional regulator [Rhizobiaceae bacterium]